MRKISIIILLLFLVGCGTPYDLTHGFRIDLTHGSKIVGNPSGFGTKLEYKSYSCLMREIEEEAKIKMWAPEELILMKERVPLGGRIILHIDRLTIAAANTEWFTVIVEENGERILKERGQWAIASAPRTRAGYWWNLMIVHINKTVEYPLKVHVIDNLQKKRFEFIIMPDHLLAHAARLKRKQLMPEKDKAKINHKISSIQSEPKYRLEEKTFFQRDLTRVIEYSKNDFEFIKGQLQKETGCGSKIYLTKFSIDGKRGFIVQRPTREWHYYVKLADSSQISLPIFFDDKVKEIKDILSSSWTFNYQTNVNVFLRKQFIAKDSRGNIEIKMNYGEGHDPDVLLYVTHK